MTRFSVTLLRPTKACDSPSLIRMGSTLLTRSRFTQHLGGWPGLDLAAITNTAGAPSLRCLQGRVAMLPTQPLSLGTKPRCACVRGSRPLQSAQRTGHPPAFSEPARFGAGPPRHPLPEELSRLHRIPFDSRRRRRATGWYRAVPIDVAGEVHYRGHGEKACHCSDHKSVVLQAQ